MVMAELGAGLQAFTAMRSIVSGLVAVRDLKMLGTIQVDLTGKILDAQSAMMALQETLSAQRQEIDALKGEVAQFKGAASQRERYELHKLHLGAFVYKLRDDVDPSEPMHYLCQGCFDGGIKSVLERRRRADLGWVQTCALCHRDISVAS